MSTELEKYKDSGAFALDEVMIQKKMVNDVFKDVMKPDIHYGIIPGTKKPSLYKPGAELLTYMHRLAASYTVQEHDLDGDHREVVATCTLTHIPTGQVWGQAVGSCNTMEGKYRFRVGNKEITGKPVPQEYWTIRKTDPAGALKLIGGKGHSTMKHPDTGAWMISIMGDKMEHDNPADYYNTVLKMAQKRAKTSATIEATAASDIFTVDIEDMPEVIQGAEEMVNKQTGEIVDVTPTDSKNAKTAEEQKPIKYEESIDYDDNEADWKREEARQAEQAGGTPPPAETKNEYEDRPPPENIKISTGKAKILYAKWKNIPDYTQEEKDALLKEWEVENLYKIKENEFEKYKTLLDAFYPKNRRGSASGAILGKKLDMGPEIALKKIEVSHV